MGNKKYIRKSILWMARIWGTLIIAFIMVFLIAHILENKPLGKGFSNAKDLVSFICFPVLTILGLALAYRWEGRGGLITSLALTSAILLNNLLDLKFILLIFPPGILYLTYWYLSRKEKQIEKMMKIH